MYTDMLVLEQLSVGYQMGPSPLTLVQNINCSLTLGKLYVLLGSNGGGKSTLLRTICGLQPPLKGNIFFDGTNIVKSGAKELARIRAVVLTDREVTGRMLVRELLALARYPYLGWFQNLRENDEHVIERISNISGISNWLDRSLDELSDGERQKVFIARAFVQDTPVIVLDEPTAFLDVQNKWMVMELLCRLARVENKLIILSTHDIDLAAFFADYFLLIKDHGIISGIPESLFLTGQMDALFSNSKFTFDRSDGRWKPRTIRGKMAIVGNSKVGFWLTRALERVGVAVSVESSYRIEIIGEINISYFLWRENQLIFETQQLDLLIDHIQMNCFPQS